MKPLNNSDPGCNYSTSNCVVWQGPDLICINLCKGDTISDVIAKLATELCSVLDTLGIKSYDLTCFGLTACAPDNFKELLQFILDRLCALEQCAGCVPVQGFSANKQAATFASVQSSSSEIVPINPIFYFKDPRTGDTVTFLPLTDYVLLIGNTVADNIASIASLQTTMNSQGARITVLENTVNNPAPIVLPEITPSCILPSVLTEMDVVLQALELQFCQLRAATGQPNDIYQNLTNQAVGLNQEKTLSNTGATMASLQGWSSIVYNMAQSMGNMWLTINDIRNSIRTLQLNSPTGCDAITLSMISTLDGDILTVFISGDIPAGFIQCSGSTMVRVTDASNNMVMFTLDLISVLNIPGGTSFSLLSTSINVALDLTIVIEPCLTNPSILATCQSYLSYVIVNNASCPTVAYTTSQGSIAYQFISQAGEYTYNIQLWDASTSTMLSNQIQSTTTPQTVSGQFTGLTPNTVYKVRVTVQPTACPLCPPVMCTFTTVTTNPPSCPAPSNASAIIT